MIQDKGDAIKTNVSHWEITFILSGYFSEDPTRLLAE